MDLKQEIINTAQNMIEAKDDSEFENKLKAICQKKKQLFEIECDVAQDNRKYNGMIKYKIKDVEKQRKSANDFNLSLDYNQSWLDKFQLEE